MKLAAGPRLFALATKHMLGARLVALAAIVVALGSFSGIAHAQPRPLERSELDAMVGKQPPQVILLTFGVGARIFEKYGHAALCLAYPDEEADPSGVPTGAIARGADESMVPIARGRETRREPVCFNYGVTNFDAGGELVWGFLRGKQKFWVDPEAWSDMVGFYTEEDRDIYEQVLPLTPAEARAIERELLTSLEESHRYYHYDHFFNNCTTRLRDMIDRTTGGKLRAGSDIAYPLTFREIGHRGLASLPPLIALSDFLTGRQLDDTPTLWQAMFHPDVLREAVTNALGVQPQLVYKRERPPFPTVGSTWRLPMLAIALVFSVPLLVAIWRRRFVRPALVWATLYLTLWGLIIWGLAIVSSIPGIRWNENALVLIPLDIVLPFLSIDRRRHYARARVAGLFFVSALCAVGVLHQPLWIPILSALLPLAIIAFDQKIAPARS